MTWPHWSIRVKSRLDTLHLRKFVHALTKDVPPLPFGSIPRPCLPVCPRIVVTAVFRFVWSYRNTCTYAHPQTHVYTFLHWRSTNKHTKSQHKSHACMCISRIHTDKMYRDKDACKHATSPRPSRCVSQVVVGWPYCQTLLIFSRCASQPVTSFVPGERKLYVHTTTKNYVHVHVYNFTYVYVYATTNDVQMYACCT